MSEMSKIWFSEIKKLAVDQAIFLRVANKNEQIKLANDLEKERETFAKLNPLHASQIFICKTLKNMKQYVTVERKYRALFTAFFKDSSGELSKLTIDPDRHRQLKLMLKDGKSRIQIEDALNGLTETEIEEFYEKEQIEKDLKAIK
jgi:hypothetical protein